MGILTEVDVLRKVGAGGVSLSAATSTVMTRSPVVVTQETSIWEAATRMKEGGFRHVPVVDSQGYPQGYISIRHLVTWLADHCSATIYTLPPDPDKVPPTAEGA